MKTLVLVKKRDVSSREENQVSGSQARFLTTQSRVDPVNGIF